MVTFRLLEAFSDRRLSLVEGDGRVMVLASSSASGAPGFAVHRPTLAARLGQFGPEVQTLVFVGGPFPDLPTVARIDEMLAIFGDEDALTDWRPVTEAVKRVESGRVVHAVDRDTLVRPMGPYVIRRHLVDAMADGPNQWIDPIEEAAGLGAIVWLWHDSRSLASRSSPRPHEFGQL